MVTSGPAPSLARYALQATRDRYACHLSRSFVMRHTLSVPGGAMDARRTRALIRDEGRLRTALDEQEKRRFDVNTALIVKYRVEDLL